MRSSGRPLLGVGYVLTAAALFAVNGSVSKALLLGSLSPLQLVELRCLGSGMVFAAVALARHPASMAIGAREFALILVYAIVGVALVQWFFLVSIARMPVSITLLIEFTAPVLIALWVRFVRREQVRRRIWVALALTVIGLGLVAEVWHGVVLDGLGVIAAGGAAVSLTVYYLLGEHGIGRRDAFSLAAWSFTTAGLFWMLSVPPWRIPWHQAGLTLEMGRSGPALPTWMLVGFVVVLGTAAPFGLVLLGLAEIGARRVGLIATAEPPLAGLVAWPVLGEALSRVQVAGVVVVLVAILLAETARHPADARAGAVAGAATT